jgi:hypothetical protein
MINWGKGSWPDPTPTSSPHLGEDTDGGELLRDEAAVDHELSASDERRFVRGQEQHTVGDFDRLAGAS